MTNPQTVWEGKFLKVEQETVSLPNGRSTTLEWMRHPGAACVLPINDQDEVLLVKQYRHATGGWLLEAPAGKLDPGETPEACARRETEEETGYRASRLESLGWIWTTPGFTDEKIWLFAAYDLKQTETLHDEDECLELHPMDLRTAVRAAQTGQIQDAKTLCSLLQLAHRL